jgi:hypothetical protein
MPNSFITLAAMTNVGALVSTKLLSKTWLISTTKWKVLLWFVLLMQTLLIVGVGMVGANFIDKYFMPINKIIQSYYQTIL